MAKSTQIKNRFTQKAHSYEANAIIQKCIGEQLFEMLQGDQEKSLAILDLGCGTGWFIPKLKKKYPTAEIIGLDLAPSMANIASLHTPSVLATAEKLPFANHTFDIVFSNLLLQWLPKTNLCLSECLRVLKPGGQLSLSTLGTQTLKEAKTALSTINRENNINTFDDIHLLGDQLKSMGWQDPVLTQDFFEVTYASPAEVFHDLKNIGANSMLSKQAKTGLLTPQRWQTCLKHYPRADENEYIATYHAIFIRALSPKNQPVKQSSDLVSFPIEKIKPYPAKDKAVHHDPTKTTE